MSEISEEATNLIDNFEYAVEDAVSDYTMACGASQKHQARRNLEDYIAELEAEIERLTSHSNIERQDDKWIPVSERLPEDLQSIIVFTKDRKTYIIRFLELYGREGFGSLSDIVTHWMPLPESPIDQLTAHNATERQDDKSPNNTQTQTIVYGKESEE